MRHSALPTALKSLLLALALSSPLAPALAQSITAAGDGTGTTVDYNAATQTYTINGGTQIDANLFHSFRQFGLSTVEIARFLANPDVVNILARVTGGQTSVINGLLQVSGGNNANLFILNPAGVLLGRNANLNLSGSFSVSTASGLSFGNEVFNVAGSNDFSALTGNPTGYVFLGNEGALLNEADLAVNPGQGITLAGNTVVNTGTLEAPEGTVSIVAVPEEGILRISQSGLILSLAVPTDQLNGLVESGITPLDLPGLLAGEWGGDATTVSTLSDGTVVFTANDTPINTDSGTVTVAGTVDVSGGEGGQVQVLGEDIALTAATIDADGTNGGGSVLVGGEYLGQGDLPTALTTTVDRDSVISANAATNGDGGRVIVWADDSTTFSGNIFARGGTLSGDGGFVETSGAQTLAFAGGLVDANAPYGRAGLWLLDPADITIGTGEATAIETALGIGTSVELTTVGTGGSSLGNINPVNPGNGDIRLEESINAVATNNAVLTLTAFRNVSSSGSATISVANGGLVLNLNQDNSSGTYATSVINNALALIGTVSDGAIVNLGAGTYQGDTIILNNANTAVTLAGAGAGTTLSGDNNRRVLQISSTTIINELTISNGLDVIGGGIYFDSNTADLTLNGNVFSENVAGGNIASINSRGGALYFSSNTGNLTLNNNVFSSNSAIGRSGAGGSIYFFSSGNSNTLFVNNVFSDNNAISNTTSGIGGGIFFDSSNDPTITLNNNTFFNNLARGSIFSGGPTSGIGGSIFFRSDGSPTLRLNSNTFSNNTADGRRGYGGGIYVFINNGSSSVILNNNTFSSNTAIGTRGVSFGGGIYFVGANSSLILGKNTFSGNIVDGVSSYGSGLYFSGDNLTLDGNTFSGNSAIVNGGGSNGGGVNFSGNSIVLRNNIVSGNSADSGPEIYVGSGSVSSNNNLFGVGGVAGTNFTLNTAPGAADLTNSLTLTATLNPLANNGGLTQTHSLIAGSPAIDASGAGALPNDQRGLAAVGNRDIGAFEFGAVPNLVVIDGNNQSTTVNTAFATPLQVQVQNAVGDPYQWGSNITFAAPGSGASLTSTNQVITLDADSIASLSATANTTAGNFSVSATAPGLTGVNFNLTNNPGAATAVALATAGGDNQSTTVNTAFTDALQVSLVDAFGNNVPTSGTTVIFTAPGSGASLDTVSQTALTDTSGIASLNATANTIAGNFTVTASSTGLTDTSFNLTNNPDAANRFTVAGFATPITAGTSGTFTVTATDQFGNLATGYSGTVGFTSTDSHGAVALPSNSPLTNGVGNFNATLVTAGNQSITATDTVTGSITGSQTGITVNAAAASNLAIAGGNNQNATVSTAFSNGLQVAVTDTFGNAVSGVDVVLSAPNAGASTSLSNTILTTDASGLATTTTTANTVAGSYQVGATATGLTGVNFDLTNTAGPATALALIGGNNQNTTVNTAFANPLQVRLVDAFGNNVSVPGTPITFTAPSSGASLDRANQTATTNASGIATTNATANTVAGDFQVGVTATGLTGINLNLSNNPGAPSALTVARGDNQSAAVNTAFADSLVVNLTDAFNNPIPNVAIAFNAPTTGASLNSTTQTATTDNNGVATVNAIANTITGNFSVQAQVGSVSANFDLENTVGSTSGAAGATLGNIGVNSLDTSALFNGHPPLESPQVLCQPIPVIDSELAEQYGVLDMPNQDDTLSSHNLRDSESVTDSPMIPRSENESTEKSQDDIELLPLCTDDLLPQI
jgi:filamentous hemagglutinin family protein